MDALSDTLTQPPFALSLSKGVTRSLRLSNEAGDLFEQAEGRLTLALFQDATTRSR
jgi:hypothetical protein